MPVLNTASPNVSPATPYCSPMNDRPSSRTSSALATDHSLGLDCPYPSWVNGAVVGAEAGIEVEVAMLPTQHQQAALSDDLSGECRLQSSIEQLSGRNEDRPAALSFDHDAGRGHARYRVGALPEATRDDPVLPLGGHRGADVETGELRRLVDAELIRHRRQLGKPRLTLRAVPPAPPHCGEGKQEQSEEQQDELGAGHAGTGP